LLPLLQTQKDLALVIPVSGTALWTDLWVQPASEKPAPLKKNWMNFWRIFDFGKPVPFDKKWIDLWIDFCLQPRVAPELSLLAKASSPIIVGMKPEDLPEAIRTNPVLLPDAKILAASDFLLPFGDAGIAQYRSLWQETRQVVKG
jgi:putative spermidine/putrescine transport system substrate-binding protein